MMRLTNWALAAAATLLLAGAAPAAVRDCRKPDRPVVAGARVPAGCRVAGPPAAPGPRDHPKGEAGFVDLGNGTQVRIGGRVRAETGFRR